MHIESDAFFHFIASGYVDPWKPESHEQNTAVMEIVGAAAVGYAEAGYWTVVDGIIIPGWFLEPLRNSLNASGFDIGYAVLRPPLAVCLRHAASRPASRLSEPAVVEQLWNALSDLGALERHAIEITDRQTAEETAELIAHRLELGTLTA